MRLRFTTVHKIFYQSIELATENKERIIFNSLCSLWQIPLSGKKGDNPMPYKRLCWLWIMAVAVCFSSLSFAQEKPSVDKVAVEKLVESLTAAKTEEERASLLAAKKELMTVELRRALIDEGVHLYSQGNYPQAFSIIQLAHSIAEQIGGRVGIAIALFRIADVYRLQGNYDQALENFQKGLSLSEELNEKSMIANALNGIGVIHGSQGDYGQAMDYFQRSLAIREELNEKAGIILTLGNIGNVHSLQGNYAQALEYS